MRLTLIFFFSLLFLNSTTHADDIFGFGRKKEVQPSVVVSKDIHPNTPDQVSLRLEFERLIKFMSSNGILNSHLYLWRGDTLVYAVRIFNGKFEKAIVQYEAGNPRYDDYGPCRAVFSFQ